MRDATDMMFDIAVRNYAARNLDARGIDVGSTVRFTAKARDFFSKPFGDKPADPNVDAAARGEVVELVPGLNCVRVRWSFGDESEWSIDWLEAA